MANRHQQNRAEQDHTPNMKMIKPAEGGIHSAVHAPKTPLSQEQQQQQGGKEAWPGPQAGQNPRT